MDSGEEKLTLRYFNGYARGELSRYILYYAQVPFDDYRVKFPEWPALKKTLPTAQLPVLEIKKKDGSTDVLCQSGVIERFLAKRYGIAGKTELEVARAGEACECLHEFINLAEKAVFLTTDETKRVKAIEELTTLHTDRLFGHLEQKLANNGGKFLTGGNEFSVGDLAIAVLFDFMRSIAPFNFYDVPKAEKTLAALSALAKRVCETSGIKTYLTIRPADELIGFRLAMNARLQASSK